MGLSTAISSALTGLQATQAGLSVVATNIANVNTPGFVRKSALLTDTYAGGNGVQVVGIGRELDQIVQSQLRAEVAGANYASTVSGYYNRLIQVYGTPGGDSLDTLFNNFTSSLNTLTSSPDSVAAQGDVLNQARVLAQQLNAMSGDVQQLRSQAESGISDAVNRVNQLLQDISDVSQRITAASGRQDASSASLLDQRDADIMELSGLIDVRVTGTGNNQVSIFTTSGVSLYDGLPAKLTFDARTAVNASSAYSTDPTKRSIGTISLTSPNGASIDLIGNKSIRSGTIAGLVELRDNVLVKAQSQLDEVANSLALSLSNRTVPGTAVTGTPAGFTVDLTGLKNGNSVSLTYTDNTSGTQHKVTIVRVDDPSVLPLANTESNDPNDQVIGVDFSGGMASVVTQLNTALGSADIVFSNTGNVLKVVDDGATNDSDVNALSASITTDTFNSGDVTLPFFVDGGSNSIYTGAYGVSGEQKTGFSSRIAINPALLSNPSALVLYSPTTNVGDSTRPDFINQQLNAAAQMFDPAGGIGTAKGPYSGTLADYIQQIISRQGADAANASQLNDGQQVVLNALQTRFNDSSGVNIDTEMSNLITLQNAYGANARVMTAIKQMYDMLLQIGN